MGTKIILDLYDQKDYKIDFSLLKLYEKSDAKIDQMFISIFISK